MNKSLVGQNIKGLSIEVNLKIVVYLWFFSVSGAPNYFV